MAYIPPHRRHSKDAEKPSPIPASIIHGTKTKFTSSRTYGGRKKDNLASRSGKILYSESALVQWLVVGSGAEDPLVDVHLEPKSVELIERRIGQKPLVLAKSVIYNGGDKDEQNICTSPLEFVMESLQRDLISSFRAWMREDKGGCDYKTSIVYRLGKILFYGCSSATLEGSDEHNVTENYLRQMKRIFFTDMSDSYINRVTSYVTPAINVDFYEEKNSYLLKLSDVMQSQGTTACKCRAANDGKKLELHKIEVNQLRHLVVDFSCLEKELDLRLMLSSKVILTSIPDEEMEMIHQLVTSAIVDPQVKGGLRWRLGEESVGDRFRVFEIWHIVAKMYKNQVLKLKVREVDRFDFKTSTGDFSREVFVKMTGLQSALQEDEEISDMFKDSLKMMWDNFLSS